LCQRIRQSWHPHNLYNLAQLKSQTTIRVADTLFRQKWAAKAATRAYHGNQVPEHRWEKMFSRYIPAVVPMDARFLGRGDGSAQAAGRGSGLNISPEAVEAERRSQRDGGKEDGERGHGRETAQTPYMGMTFWPLERRLDSAIFRALFACSVSQARQMVIHGHVKVNGKRMIHPGYLLNPGDLFSVTPDVVLNSTGMPANAEEAKVNPYASIAAEEAKAKAEEEAEEEAASLQTQEEQEPGEDLDLSPTANDSEIIKTRKKSLTTARTMIDDIILKFEPSAARKRELRALRKNINPIMGRARKTDDDGVDAAISALEKELDAIFAKIETSAKAEESAADGSEGQGDKEKPVEDEHLSALAKAYNDLLVGKKYAQPWQPRDWMAPFAFVPRYLEVNWTICSAVYLRHPVARPGVAEIPSPFGLETGGLAFTWYLRRR
jgi:ribosomal protein S4